jgi:60 kDa SS-A/Ro ribonucleoprotein
MADAYSAVRTRAVAAPIRRNTTPASTAPQRQKAAKGQVRNEAGGYVFDIGDEARLHRFLTMGTEGGTFYLNEQELTKENASVVFRAAEQAPQLLVKAIIEISKAGRAPKYKPAIFALAIAASHADDAGRKAALEAVPVVCRTTTQLFLFLDYVQQFRGWGRGLRKAVGAWYDAQDIDKLGTQIVKYRQREGWRHIDALRKASDRGPDRRGAGNRDYTSTFDADHRLLYNYAAGNGLKARDGGNLPGILPDVVLAYEALKKADTLVEVLKLANVPGVTWEMIPDKWINTAELWHVLLAKGMPQGALIRQLPRLTRAGVLTGVTLDLVANQLVDADRLKGARIHPMQLLVAARTYAQGRSERGSSTWTPSYKITEALTDGFYASFGAFTPAGVPTVVGIDCSGSMGWSQVGGLPMTVVEATAAVAMVTAATEPEARFVAFDNRAWELDGVSSRRLLSDVTNYLKSQIAGGTDVSQPILWATHNRVKVDSFQILTDGQTWQGSVHPFKAMETYRNRINPDARLSVVAMAPTNHSVVAPWDDKAIDVSGFDASVPQILADFAGGRL